MALTPEQRKKAQEILNKESGQGARQKAIDARRERSEKRKEKELELKQANLKIRQDREKRRGEGESERKKRNKLKDKQKELAKNISDKSKEVASHKKAAAQKPTYQTTSDQEGEGTALGKIGSNVAKAGASAIGSTYHRVRSMQKQRSIKKTQKVLDATKKEEFLYEVDKTDDNATAKMKKVVDVMRGKNKIEIDPQIQAEALGSQKPQSGKQSEQEKQHKLRLLRLKMRMARKGMDVTASYEPTSDTIQERSLDTFEKNKKEDIVKGITKSSKAVKSFKKRYGKDWKNVMHGAATNQAKEAGDTSKSDERYSSEEVTLEAKVDTGTPAQKASARNKRNTPPGQDNRFDTSVFITRKPGESLESARTRMRQKQHATKRGVSEAKVDQGLDDEAKEDTRNYRKFGTKHNQAGTARFRRTLHRSRRGEKKIKGQKVPADAYGESVTIEDAKGNSFLEIIDIIKPEPMKSPKNNIQFEEDYGTAKKPSEIEKKKKLDMVLNAVQKEKKRKNALQIQKVIGT